MTVNASLSISSLISVTSSLAAAAVQGQGTGTLLVLSGSAVIDPVTRLESFASDTAVATLFGDDAPETQAAEDYFGQSPQPTQPLLIGRWVQTASSGQLFGAPLTAAQQLIATWNAITDGGFGIAINGASVTQVSGLNFSGSANMNGVAAVIQAALEGATAVWSAVNSNFVITSSTTGATSTVSFLTTPTGEGVTDISSMLGMTAAASGCYQAPGMAAESALAAVTIFDAQFGGQWYGLSVIGAADTDVEAIVPFLNASSNKHFYFASTQEAGVLVAAYTTDIASVLSSSNAAKVAVQYNGSSPYSAISLAGKMLAVDYTGSNTVIAAMWQQEPTITSDNLNANQLAAVQAKNANVFVGWNNGASIIIPGVCSNGQWIDTVIGADALALAIQNSVFNLLYSGIDIGQDDAGMHIIKTSGIQPILTQFVNNGFIAPGIWNYAGFGSLIQGQTLSSGWYIYQPPVAAQSSAQRQSRISVPFQVAANLQGAVGTVNVAITLGN